MRKLFVGGNFKSNGNKKFIQSHCENVLNKMQFDPSKLDVIVSPLFIHLSLAQQHLKNNVQLASQNISVSGDGAFTGEISGSALKDLGINWAIIGHSERRSLFGESNVVVANKVVMAIEQGISAIACIGESKEERESNKTINVVQKQLKAMVDKKPDWSKVVIAYEPVWAIGTGLTASPDQAQEVHYEIRKFIGKEVSSDVSKSIRIIYGGSVTDKNASELISKEDIDGFLVGGASLKEGFRTIVENTKRI